MALRKAYFDNDRFVGFTFLTNLFAFTRSIFFVLIVSNRSKKILFYGYFDIFFFHRLRDIHANHVYGNNILLNSARVFDTIWTRYATWSEIYSTNVVLFKHYYQSTLLHHSGCIAIIMVTIQRLDDDLNTMLLRRKI